MADSDEEVRKVITASLRGGASHLFWDNINRKVTSGALASALTTGKFTDRVLGGSKMATSPIRCVWIMAGNRISFTHELMRRNVPIRIDAAHPDPAKRLASTFAASQA